MRIVTCIKAYFMLNLMVQMIAGLAKLNNTPSKHESTSQKANKKYHWKRKKLEYKNSLICKWQLFTNLLNSVLFMLKTAPLEPYDIYFTSVILRTKYLSCSKHKKSNCIFPVK